MHPPAVRNAAVKQASAEDPDRQHSIMLLQELHMYRIRSKGIYGFGFRGLGFRFEGFRAQMILGFRAYRLYT